MSDSSHSAGVVVAGADNGSIYYYDAAGMIEGDSDCLMFKKNKHVGAVKALDFNPFQVRFTVFTITDISVVLENLTGMSCHSIVFKCICAVLVN